jgi:DNA-binding CsgD family transcriptional regulator
MKITKHSELENFILELHAQHYSITKIANMLCCGRTQVYNVIKKHRKAVAPPPSYQKAEVVEKSTSTTQESNAIKPPDLESNESTRQRIKQLWIMGKSNAQIAKIVDLAWTTTRQILISLGTKERPLKAMHDERMVNLRRLGKTYQEIGQIMGISASCAHKRITAMKAKENES